MRIGLRVRRVHRQGYLVVSLLMLGEMTSTRKAVNNFYPSGDPYCTTSGVTFFLKSVKPHVDSTNFYHWRAPEVTFCTSSDSLLDARTPLPLWTSTTPTLSSFISMKGHRIPPGLHCGELVLEIYFYYFNEGS